MVNVTVWSYYDINAQVFFAKSCYNRVDATCTRMSRCCRVGPVNKKHVFKMGLTGLHVANVKYKEKPYHDCIFKILESMNDKLK